MPNDFSEVYKYRPVLLETFVDSERYGGTCYTGAGWEFLGKTAGRGRMDTNHEHKESIKLFFVRPIDKNFRDILRNQKKKKNEVIKRSANHKQDAVPDSFVDLWTQVMSIVSSISIKYDQMWQVRRRVIDTPLIILLILRIVFSKNRQGYRTTIDDLWHQCKMMKVNLPQERPIAASSFSAARAKLDENVFKEIKG